MSITTYLIRVFPLVLFKKEINNKFVKSFLYYVPYVCLATMTFPAILNSSSSWITGLCAFIVALYASYKEKSMFIVAILACLTVFILDELLLIL